LKKKSEKVLTWTETELSSGYTDVAEMQSATQVSILWISSGRKVFGRILKILELKTEINRRTADKPFL
jgi:hypothetical protein